MPAKYFIISFLFLVTSFSASAINVGSVTTIMPSNKRLTGKEIKNESPSARVISVNIERVDSPLSNGKVIPLDRSDEILISPSQLMMPGRSKNIIKFWYKGDEDNRERYYRINFTDEPIGEDEKKSSGKSVLAQARAIISTILVVQPRDKNLDYNVVRDGVLNKGNVSFRITAMGNCQNEKKECREMFYVLPGRTYRMKKVDLQAKGTHLGLWDIDRYIPLQ